MEEIETWKTALFGEALLMGLLGKVLYEEPDQAWLDSLIADRVFADAPFGENNAEVRQGLEVLQAWSQRNANGLSVAEFDAIKKDTLYTFIGVDKVIAPPWESVYFSERRLIFQKETYDVRDWYASFGLQAECKNREPDDHIGLEMVFLANLATQALRSLEAGDDNGAERYIQAQRDFLSRHPLRWGPAWANLVMQNAATDFYRGIALLLHGALIAAADLLDVPVPEEVVL